MCPISRLNCGNRYRNVSLRNLSHNLKEQVQYVAVGSSALRTHECKLRAPVVGVWRWKKCLQEVDGPKICQSWGKRTVLNLAVGRFDWAAGALRLAGAMGQSGDANTGGRLTASLFLRENAACFVSRRHLSTKLLMALWICIQKLLEKYFDVRIVF